MLLVEFSSISIPSKTRSDGDDQSVPKLSDVRKTKLTLNQIKKMRMMYEVKRYEQAQKIEKLKKQYGKPEETAETF